MISFYLLITLGARATRAVSSCHLLPTWTILFVSVSMDFKLWNGKIGPARVAEKVSHLWPKTWILRSETGKLDPRECWKKYLIFVKKHGFYGLKRRNRVISSGGKVSTFWPKTWTIRCETEKSGPRECRKKCLIFDRKHGFWGVKRKNRVRPRGGKVSNFWPKTWILSCETEIWVGSSGGKRV